MAKTMVTKPGFVCDNSGARVPLSVAEEMRRWVHCSRCGRDLKVRPVRESDGRRDETNGNPVATLPRHKEPRA
jgi:transcription initiation factor IIE alpha subunit